MLSVPEGTRIVIDGSTGEIHVDPDAAAVEEYRRRAAELEERRTRDLARASEPATSLDGTHVLVLGRNEAPDVDEQEREYVAIGEALGGRRSTLRTLDVGGDKPLTYLPMPHEENPFLGLRGLRLALERPGLLADQLVAICRSARRVPTSSPW